MPSRKGSAIMTVSIAEIYKRLQFRIPGRDGQLYGHSTTNFIGGKEGYLLDSPQGFWRRPDEHVAGKHSSRLPLAIRALIEGAERWVDIVTMDEPDGDFHDGLLKAIETLAKSGKEVTIRIVAGRSVPGGRMEIEKKIREIAKLLKDVKGQKLTVFFAQYRWEMASWGHIKLVAVDGQRMIQGGHNLWGKDYLGTEPVFDLSMRYDGPVAIGGHRLAERIWAFVRKYNGTGPTAWTFCWSVDRDLNVSMRPSDGGPVWEDVPAGSVPALWVVNPGWGVFREGGREVINNGFVHAFARALEEGSYCRISQQDLGATWLAHPDFAELDNRTPGLGDYPYNLIACQKCYFILPLFDALADFLRRDDSTRLELVISPEHKSGRGYTNKIPASAIFNLLGQRMWVQSRRQLSKARIYHKLGSQLTIKNISFSYGRSSWPPLGNPKYNHAKFWMVDDVFYVGSENFYPSTTPALPPALLQEFGVIAQATPETRKMILDEYYTPLFECGVPQYPKLSYLTWKEGEMEDAARPMELQGD